MNGRDKYTRGLYERGGDSRFSWERTGPESYEFRPSSRRRTLVYMVLMLVFYVLARTHTLQPYALIGMIVTALLIRTEKAIMNAIGPFRVDENGLTVISWFKRLNKFIPWEQFRSMSVMSVKAGEMPIRLSYVDVKKGLIASIIIGAPKGNGRDILLSLIKKRVANVRVGESEEAMLMAKTPRLKDVESFAGWRATNQYLLKGKEHVSWQSIRSIGAGIGNIGLVITYDGGMGEKEVRIKSLMGNTEGYKRFLKKVLLNAANAELDYSVLIPLQDLRKAMTQVDPLTAGVIICALIISIIGTIVLGFRTFYTDIRGNDWLIFLPMIGWLAGVLSGTLLTALKALPGKPEAKDYRVSGWLGLGLVPMSMFLFFVLYPGGATWLMADADQLAGRYEKARTGYEECQKLAPDSKFLVYDLAINSHSMGRWEESVSFFKKAYHMDEKYIHTSQVMQFPDALLQLGKKDEARRWCEVFRKRNDSLMPDCNRLEERMDFFRRMGFSAVRIIIYDIFREIKNIKGLGRRPRARPSS